MSALIKANTAAVLSMVANERARQDAKWGEQKHAPQIWLAILMEEMGEVAKEVADPGTDARAFNPYAYREEMVQVAAVAVAAVEALAYGASWSSRNDILGQGLHG
jgi:NTP pyrophosphatase (non-canonical NTP hydrolase)